MTATEAFSSPGALTHVATGAAVFGNDLPLALMAAPCVLESRSHALEMASALKDIANRLGLGLVYKSSFDKANRTSGDVLAPSAARLLAFPNLWGEDWRCHVDTGSLG